LIRPEIVIATKNRGKAAEFRHIMEELSVSDLADVTSLSEFPDYPDVDETGASFEENALIKARAAAAHTGLFAVAEDSGIEVEILDGAPGVRSARLAGPGATDAANNEKLLGLLSGMPAEKRGALFVAVIALVSPDGRETTVRGECRGLVADAPRGTGGFGYGPVFFYPPLNKTYAEMSDSEKYAISHRRRAIEALCRVLPEFLAAR
jgi:XTP/dITP diphosphohydrolase